MMFSIITVVLNDAAGLKLTAASVENQSLLGFEWIVIDGNSSDGTLIEVSNLSKIKPVVYSETDLGIYDAMNKGVKIATGQYLIFMNAGDTFADEMVLTELKRFLVGKAHIDVVLGGTFKKIKKCIFYSPPRSMDWIVNGLPAFHQSTVYKSELLRARPYNLRYKLLADYEWLAEQCISGLTVGYLPMPISNFYPGGVSYGNLKQKFIDLFYVKRSVLGFTMFQSAASSFLAILKTIFVMQVLFRICSLYEWRCDGCITRGKQADSVYYKYHGK